MKSGKHILSWFFMLLSLCWSMNAQQTSSFTGTVPRVVNYSGKATDAQGKAISGIAGATFAIYKDQNEGAPLWLETQSIQADAKGNYTVQLGATKPDGLPQDLFSSGQARWLGVTVNGGQEQPRVLLLSVPYALKAADAETIGGLPPSAFMLAAPASVAMATSASANVATSSASSQPPTTSTVTTTGGTVNALPLWTTTTNIQSSALAQTGTGTTAKVGINTTTPASTLDVNGAGTVRGNLSLPATGSATATSGKNSQPTTFTASVFNKTTGKATTQNFRWQAEAVGNNTASASGSLNLLYGSGTNPINETGLHVASNGQVTFAPGQTFPGAGTVSSVGFSAPGSDFTVSGSPVTNSGTLALNWKVAPTSAKLANAIVKRDGSGGFVAGQITAGGLAAAGTITASAVGIGTSTPAQALDLGNNGNMIIRVDPGNDTSGGDGGYGLVGRGAGGVPNTWWTFTAPVGGGFGVPVNSYSIWQYPPNSVPACCLNRLTILPAESPFDSGGTVTIDQNGNTQQQRTAGGMVKALLAYDGNANTIVNCFNSTLSGSAATIPPCGFSATSPGTGIYVLDFGFQVTDRFLSVTPTSSGICQNNGCPGPTFWVNMGGNQPASQASVAFFDISGVFVNSTFHLVVY